jgi:hypothetical protein
MGFSEDSHTMFKRKKDEKTIVEKNPLDRKL